MRSIRSVIALQAAGILILAAAMGVAMFAPVRFEASDLGKLPPGAMGMTEGLFSPDGSRWAAVVVGLRDAKKSPLPENMVSTVVVDGKADTPCSRVANLGFSPDSRHVLYRAYVDTAGKPSTSSIIMDGSPAGLYDSIVSEPAFSPDGKLAPFLARKGDRYAAVVDGKSIQETADTLAGLTISPDGRRLMYSVSRIVRDLPVPAIKSSVVLDGKEDGGRYDRILYTWFSPDSRRTVWAAMNDGKFVVAVDGKIERTGAEKITPVRFSPNSAHVAYGFGVWNSSRLMDCSIIVDGALRAKHEIIGNPQFSPDASVWWSGNYWETSAKGSNEVMFGVFHEGKKVYASDQYQIVNIDFSADGKHAVYEALPKNPDKSKSDSRAYILDGKPGPVYDKVLPAVFSPDGAHLAFGAAKGGSWVVVLDGQPQAGFEDVSRITFSPDSRHLLYQAKAQGRLTWVLDSQLLSGYDQISRPQFLPGGKIDCLAVKSGQIQRVHILINR